MKQPIIQRTKRFVRPVAIGISAGGAVCALLLALFSLLMRFRDIPQPAVLFCATLVLVIAGFSAGFISAACARERGLPMGICCGTGIFLLLCFAWLLVDGTGLGAGAIAKLAALLFAAAIGGIFGVNKKRRFAAIRKKD